MATSDKPQRTGGWLREAMQRILVGVATALIVGMVVAWGLYDSIPAIKDRWYGNQSLPLAQIETCKRITGVAQITGVPTTIETGAETSYTCYQLTIREAALCKAIGNAPNSPESPLRNHCIIFSQSDGRFLRHIDFATKADVPGLPDLTSPK